MAASRLTPVGLVPRQGRPPRVPVENDPAAAAAALEALERQLEELRATAVAVHAAALEARQAGATWETLAGVLGLSHASSARKRLLSPDVYR